jgi:hypothetical protein
MGLFDRLFAAEKPDAGLVAEMTDAIVEAVEPKVKLHSRYQRKLEPSIRRSIDYLRSLAREPLDPVLLSRASWASDPRVNAFFATAQDVPACLGRSHELRRFFDSDPAPEAYALLGMKMEERSVLGMELVGEAVQRDVQQKVVSFSGHQLVAPHAVLAEARLEVGRRLLLRLAQLALMRIVATDEKATELGEHKAYLGARLRLLRLAEDGMEGIVKDRSKIAADRKALERELKETVDGYIETKGSLATLDGYMGHIQQVFSAPEQHIGLSHSRLRLSTLGVRLTKDAAGPANELDIVDLSIGPDFRAAIAVARCPRAEMPSKEDLIAQAERLL